MKCAECDEMDCVRVKAQLRILVGPTTGGTMSKHSDERDSGGDKPTGSKGSIHRKTED